MVLLAVCGVFLYVLEAISGGRSGVSVFFDGVDGGGFDVFDGVEEAVEFHEAVEVVDADAAEGGFEAEAVLVEYFGWVDRMRASVVR